MSHSGHRNLVLLGACAFCIAAITTAVELSIYRSSGDIYLDRSRPGYLPDAEEVEDEADESSYIYSDTGTLDASELDKYLDELKAIQSHIDKLPDPYSADPLSDESLGITAPSTPEKADAVSES